MASHKAAQQQHAGSSFDIEALPEELVIRLIRRAGVAASLAKLAGQGSSRLHRAWQAAVKRLTISDKLTPADREIIAKFPGLEHLSFVRVQQGPPVWHALLGAASLSGLKCLSIIRCHDTFGVLRFLPGCKQLQRSIQALALVDEEQDLTDLDVWGLEGMTKLKHLGIRCRQLHGDFADAAGMLSQLSALQRLAFTTIDTPTPAQLAVLPGSMLQLTRLDLHGVSSRITQATLASQQQGLAAAVSRLTNLQGLHTNYTLMAPGVQRQALGGLQNLADLNMVGNVSEEPLVVVPQLSRLVTLDAPQLLVCNPLPHPSLQWLAAANIQLDPPAAGQPVLRCPLQQLFLLRGVEDATLQHLPQLLPELRTLKVGVTCGAGGRYSNLAALLHRQAYTLQELNLTLGAEPFVEALPRALPLCRVLQIDVHDRHVVQLLAMCRLPVLQKLVLVAPGAASNLLDVALDLGWLRRLRALRQVEVDAPPAAIQQMRAAISAVLQASRVQVAICQPSRFAVPQHVHQ